MSIKQGLVFNESQDTVEGFEDFGTLGKTRYIANHAIAFIVRGLASKWKQPFGYFLSSGPIRSKMLQSLTKACITKLTEVGLNVVALVCDQGSNNRSFLQQLERVSITKPYIEHNGKKIFIFYDPPHLLKNVRNNLKRADLQVGDNMASWQHIVDFYNFDKMQMIQMAPKLKDKHIELPPFASMRVNLAAQVLSHSVAAGISTLVVLKQLNEDAKYTTQFIEHFDVLFNCFNSRNLKSSQKLGKAFSDRSGHHGFLKDSLKLLNTIKTKGGAELPCIFGWKLNIVSLFGLWEYLKKEQGFKFLFTSRLNQDCAENLFSIIRGMGGHRDNPDVAQLKACFKYVVADQLFVQSHLSNCQVDNDTMLLNISNIAMARYEKPVTEDIETLPTADIAMVMTTPLSQETQNVGAYLAGYLLRKVSVNDCNECIQQLLLPKLPSEFTAEYEFLKQKAYKDQGSLIYPTLAMAKFVDNLETVFCSIFEGIVYMPFVLRRLCKSAEKYCEFLTCQTEECRGRVRKMMLLYMRVRIYHSLKKSNATNAEDKSVKRNRKMLKLSHL